MLVKSGQFPQNEQHHEFEKWMLTIQAEKSWATCMRSQWWCLAVSVTTHRVTSLWAHRNCLCLFDAASVNHILPRFLTAMAPLRFTWRIVDDQCMIGCSQALEVRQ